MAIDVDRALSIRAAADEAGDRAFFVDDEGATSFREVAEQVARLEALEVPAGSLALEASPTRATLLRMLWALEAKVPLVPLHPRWTSDERARALGEVRASTRWGPPHLAILFTSGSSGARKGALLSRAAFVRAAEASAARLGWREADRWLLAMPLAHVGGLSILVRTLVARRGIVLYGERSFDPHALVDTIARHEATLASLVPTQLARLVDAGCRPPACVRAVLLGGARSPERVLERAMTLGWPLHVTYGLTETCAQVATSRARLGSLEEARAEGVGEPLDGVAVRIHEGRVFVRSASSMDGWLDASLGDPFDADGFYDTGDVGRLDVRGRLHVEGRRGEQIVTGGENVMPSDVEAALLSLDGVREACVVGLPDETWGERVAAALVTDAPFDEAALIAALRERLPSYALPRRLVRLEALPTNSTGKLDRRRVRERLAQSPKPADEGLSSLDSERK